MTRKENAQNKQQLLEWHFGKYRRAWDGEHEDDRGLIAGMYDQMMEALKEMEKVENNFIWVAFNKMFREQERTMCRIIKQFTGSYPVYGSGAYKCEYFPEEM